MREPKFPSREPVIKRLRRAEGHLGAILEMLTANRPPAAIAQQLQAVEAAVSAAKTTLVHDQIRYALRRSDAAGGVTRELSDLTKYL